MTDQTIENFATEMLNSAINGINEAVASKQKEVNYWRQKAQAQPTNEQLLRMLGERIKTGEIKGGDEECGCGTYALCAYLYLNDIKGKEILRVDLETGKIESEEEVAHA